MITLDSIREAQTQSIEQIKNAQEQIVSANERIADTVLGAMPAMQSPFSDFLPRPTEMIDAYFAFAGSLYEANRDFVARITTVWEQPEAAAAAKPKPKAK